MYRRARTTAGSSIASTSVDCRLTTPCGAIFTGWLAGPSFKMAAEQQERWTARIDATRKYWLFVDLVWLVIVLSFYVV